MRKKHLKKSWETKDCYVENKKIDDFGEIP